jgi:hypothetical protein
MSEDNQQRPIQVGDEIAFQYDGIRTRWEVFKVDKITKSGRIRAGHFELNPDLTIRGAHGWRGPDEGVLMTDELRKEIVDERRKNAIVEKVSAVKWRLLSLAKLQKIDAILKEFEHE